MKVLSAILSILILSMSSVPCIDDISNVQAEPMDIQHDFGHQHSEKDHCTPFCVCSCCGTSVTLLEIKMASSTISISSPSELFHYNFEYNYTHFNHVWQPPKFV